jgi:tRNA-specific 2-thiouridylase
MRAVVAMSGGVDSSVAAYLMQKQGYDVTGAIMKIWDKSLPEPHSLKKSCFGPDEEQDVEDARRVCDRLGIPLRVLDCAHEFMSVILDYFRAEYEHGRTPNPCVFCNRLLKFDMIQRLLKESGLVYDVFATGHYARVERTSASASILKRAKDISKDQSYFLYRLSGELLASTRFPLGELTKKYIREMAREIGLATSEKEESQDFYAGDYRDLLDSLGVNAAPGTIVDTDGRVLGTHAGLHLFTIGQRKGLGVTSAAPLYVVEIRPDRNEVVVGPRDEKWKTGLYADDLNMFTDTLPQKVQAKIRSSHTAASCTAERTGDTLHVTFDEQQEGITPGQSVVLYDGDTVLGGGVIRNAL